MAGPLPPFPGIAPVPTQALWEWNNSTNPPTVLNYSSGTNTKTGLQPVDLQNFVGVPTIFNYNPPVPVSGQQLLQIIRQAEDWVETNMGVLLCESWVSSPAMNPLTLAALGGQVVITSNPASGMILGVDYDVADIGYDFFYRRYLNEAWGVQQLRYRPLQNVYYMFYIYPLLSQYYQIPLSWIVQDTDYSMIRLVPSANIEMLPLFAMQLSLVGFAQSVPQAIYLQYTAGLTTTDYNNRFSFVKTLVLSVAAIYLLNILQGSINYGQTKSSVSVDGLKYDSAWPASGAAYSGLIGQFTRQRDELLETGINLIRGGLTLVQL